MERESIGKAREGPMVPSQGEGWVLGLTSEDEQVRESCW